MLGLALALVSVGPSPWVGSGRAHAQAGPPDTVVVVRVPGDDSIVLALRTEMSGYRFRVVELADRAARRTRPLSELAEEREAQAAVRSKPSDMAVELWTRGNGAEPTASEEIVDAGPGRNPELLAMRVTEAMRARGLTLPPLSAATPTRYGQAAPPVAAGAADEPDAAEGPRPATTPVAAGSAPNAPPLPTAAAQPAPNPPTAKPARRPSAADAKKPSATDAATADADRSPKPASPRPRAEPTRTATPNGTTRSASSPRGEATARAGRDGAPAKPAGVAPSSPSVLEPAAVSSDHGDGEPTASLETSDARPAPPPRAALAYVEAGAAGVWSPGADRVGPALDAVVSVRFRPYSTSSISLVGLIPLLKTPVERPDARIEITTFGIGGFGDFHVPFEQFELSAGLGGLALISSVLAFSDVYQVASPTTQRLAALLGRVGASVAISRDLRASASVMGGLAVTELRIEVPANPAGAEATAPPTVTWGHPLLMGSLSLELALPWDR